MAVFVNIPSLLALANVSQYLAQADIKRQKAKGEKVDDDLPLLIYMVKKDVEWAYSQNPNDPTLNATGLYLNALIGPYVNEATLVLNSGGCIPPSILVNPAPATINAGDNISFNVDASGTATLTYQWLKNGSPIVGATSNVYSITNAQLTDAGAYSVNVSNSCGMVTSLSAILTVNVGLFANVYYTSSPDPYILLGAGTDNLTYNFNAPIVHNQPINITLPGAAGLNQYIVIRVPATESVKANWFNTSFNFGTIPDSVFRAYFTIGSNGYYVTRIQATFDTTASPNLILS